MPAFGDAAPDIEPEIRNPFELLQLLWGLDHALAVASKRMDRRIGVTGPQRVALLFIDRHPRIELGELARAMGVHPSTVTCIVDRLAANLLVERARSETDRRRQELVITPSGVQLLASKAGTIEEAFSSTLAALPAEDVDATRRLLRTILRALGGPDPLAGADLGTPTPTRSGRRQRCTSVTARTAAACFVSCNRPSTSG